MAGEGDPAVLVHGLAGSMRWWAPTIPALSRERRLYLVDLPGFGTMRRSAFRFVLREAASWLKGWLDAAGLAAADFVGHSMGSAICVRLAARHPESVRRLVLIAPAGLAPGRSRIGHLLPLARAVRRARPAFLPVLVRDALKAGPRTLWRAAGELVGQDVREELEAVKAPTLLVFGERDPLVPLSAAAIYRGAIAGSRLLVLDRAGHVPMFDRPHELNGALTAFLAGEPVGE